MKLRNALRELEALIEEDDPALQEALLHALRHPIRGVRIFAALNLAELFQDIQAVGVLAEALESGSRNNQRAVAGALWEIGDANPKGLVKMLVDAPPVQRDAAANALYWVGWIPDDPSHAVAFYILSGQWRACIAMGSEALPGLFNALDDWDGNVRRGAAWALGEIGDAGAVPYLVDMLADTGGGLFGVGDRVCDVAAEALAKINTPEARDALDHGQNSA